VKRTPLVPLLVLLIAPVVPACVCSKTPAPSDDGSITTTASKAEGTGWAAPIAATHVNDGAVVVAGVDLAAKAIRVRKIGEKDEILADRIVLEGVAPSTEADLKVVPAAGGAAITWRGLRQGKLVRELVVTRPDLTPIGSPVEVAAASCATRDALYWTDGKKVHARRWTEAAPSAADSSLGPASLFDLPKDKEAGLVCAAHRAFAVLEEEEATSLLPFPLLSADASTSMPAAMSLLRDRDFGDDEQRERAEYTVDDDFGVVRLGNAGNLAIRELRAGALQPIRRLKTSIPHDDDVVAVDASPRGLVIVYTQEMSEACPSGAVATKVRAIRVDRTTWEESSVDLAPGACGREVGPFFTSAKGEGVVIAWVEHTSATGKARAPISGVAHVLVTASGAAPTLERIEEAAEALVDAGCDATHCYAAALVREAETNRSNVRVLRYR
jgi:hypothetical protein